MDADAAAAVAVAAAPVGVRVAVLVCEVLRTRAFLGRGVAVARVLVFHSGLSLVTVALAV